jgi:putative transposase
MYLSVPPKYSPSYVMKILKGKSAELLMREYPMFRKRYWRSNIWARGYFVSTVGINRELIKRYIQSHREEEERETQLKIWRKV